MSCTVELSLNALEFLLLKLPLSAHPEGMNAKLCSMVIRSEETSSCSGRLDQTVNVLVICCEVLEVWLEEGMQGTSETHLADMNMGECGIAYEQPLLNPLDTTLYLPHDEQLVVVHVDRQPQLIAHREDDLLLTDSVGG